MRAINVLLSILVSLVIGIAVLEGGLRLIGLGPTVTLNTPDSVTGWSKKPNLELSRKHPDTSYKIDFKLNSMGLRDDEISEKKPDGVYRVIALGDSFTLGFGVNREDLFVDVLEQWWNEEGRRVEVINSGTEGYSTDQQVVWFEEVGSKLDPDLVLIFPYENDLYWNGRSVYVGREKPRYNADGTRENRTIAEPEATPWVEGFALTSKLFGKGRPQLPDEDKFQPPGCERRINREWAALIVDTPEFMNDALARTKGSLLALKNKCASLGCGLVMAPIPSHSAISATKRESFGKTRLPGVSAEAWSPDLPVDTFLEIGSSLGIKTIDSRTSFRGMADAGGTLYHTKDWHLNEDGNFAFARVLHDELDRQAVFPEDRRPTAGTPVQPSRAESSDEFLSPGVVTLFTVLWVLLTVMYILTYADEPKWQPPLKVGALLIAIFGIVLGTTKLLAILPPVIGQVFLILAVLTILGFVAYKLGRRLGTIAELFKAFTLRGHWYLMPLVVILLTIGSLLVVAASSPLVAPFIYTLF